MQRKLYRIFLIIIIAIAGFIGYKFYQQYQVKNNRDHLRIANILHPHKKKQTTANNQRNNRTPSYSNNEWLIMGYMAYARHNYEQSRDANTTKKLVKYIKEDLQNGALHAKKEDKTEYILSNKFGSINGYVKENTVQITGDGNHVFNKEDLRNTFGPYEEDVKQMSLMIK